MGTSHPIWYISGAAFIFGIVWLLASAGVGALLSRQLLPLLADTKEQIQDLGDLAANAVGRAAETMDLVELRVSQTMGQATQAGVSVTRQALGLGSILAGIYMVSRFASVLQGQGKHRRKRSRRRR